MRIPYALNFEFHSILLLEFQIVNVLTVLDFSGRIDHILSQINTLHKVGSFSSSINCFLLTKNSLAWLLQPGQHTIQIPDRFVTEEYWCSYVPIGSRCRVTTNGLKWDLGEFNDFTWVCVYRTTNSIANSLQTTQFVNSVGWSVRRTHMPAQMCESNAINLCFGQWAQTTIRAMKTITNNAYWEAAASTSRSSNKLRMEISTSSAFHRHHVVIVIRKCSCFCSWKSYFYFYFCSGKCIVHQVN